MVEPIKMLQQRIDENLRSSNDRIIAPAPQPREDRMSLCALDQEFTSLRGIFDNPTCSEADRAAAAWRIDELVEAINTTPPENLADCVAKLSLLADRELGRSVRC